MRDGFCNFYEYFLALIVCVLCSFPVIMTNAVSVLYCYTSTDKPWCDFDYFPRGSRGPVMHGAFHGLNEVFYKVKNGKPIMSKPFLSLRSFALAHGGAKTASVTDKVYIKGHDKSLKRLFMDEGTAIFLHVLREYSRALC